MPSSPTPTLLSVTATGNNTITLHFSEAMAAGEGNLIISGGHSQTYMTKDGLATRIVGAHDTRPVSASDSQVNYSGTDVVITLTTPLEAGLTYSVTMGNNVLRTVASDIGFHSISSTSQFFFTTTATAHSAPSATVDAAMHFTDSGASSTDFVTSWDAQVVTGTYTGTLGTNDFVQVSLDNGASWHKASASGNAWSYSGSIDTANLGSGQDSTFTSKILARVGNTYTLNSGTVSQTYTYDHQVPSAPSSSFALSNDSGTSSSDYITNVASQTISGTIAGLSGSGLAVQISMSNGDTWDNATVSGNNWNAAVTLNQIGKVLVRVVDLAGNASSSVSKVYDYDTGVSLSGHALTLLSDFDTGTLHNDHITRSFSYVTLAVDGMTGLNIGDRIELIDTSHGSAVVGHYTIQSTDLDGYGVLGTTTGKMHHPGSDISFQNITLESLADGAYVLAARVTDVAGNVSTALSDTLSLTIDNTAPTLTSSTPAESAGSVTVVAHNTLSFTFNEDIYVADGTVVTITDDDDPNSFQQVTLSNSDISGNTLSFTLNDALTAGTHYTVQGATITDAAGNAGITGDTVMLHFTTAGSYPAPATPALSIADTAPASDTNSSSTFHTDHITKAVTVQVAELNETGTWYYRLHPTDAWTEGSGSSFVLDEGTYAANQIEVKQTVHGVDSAVTSNSDPVTVDTHAAGADVTGSTSFSSGDNTIGGNLTHSTDLPNEIVEVTLDHGATWLQATTSAGSTGNASWTLSGISAQLTDNFGVRVSDQAGNITEFADRAGTYVTYYLSDGAVITYNHAGDDHVTVVGNGSNSTITLGNHSLVYTGNYGNVTMGDDAFVSGLDNLTVTTGNGNNTVYAHASANITTGSGSDMIGLTAADNATVHAGAGDDTLFLLANASLNLDSLTGITGVENISFVGTGPNDLTIASTAGVQHFVTGSTLTITNNNNATGTTVHLNDLVWADAGTQSGYHAYHDLGNTMVILVATTIAVDLNHTL
ncbi:Ig-like domain-containing protein [Duganella sp. Dugasp56]|uniref:Ig-like domain-containing protein n=1 Tax=Duganella sp. Dugasp56 TaxID=3243046 RepID=UPI0039AF53D9